jgi:capsular polysaccharide biosynthesis protein
MSVYLSRLLGKTLGVVVRRRWLLCGPIVLTLLATPAALYLIPRTYTATTLLLLQENTSDSPMARELRYTEPVGDKVAGMLALLKSDRLLFDSLMELHGPYFAKDRNAALSMKEDLRHALSMISAGGDFFQIQLRSQQPVGMGRTLEVVTARMIESVVSSDMASSSAHQFVDRRLTKRVLEATRSLEAFLALQKTATDTSTGSPKWTRSDLLRERKSVDERLKLGSAEAADARLSAPLQEAFLAPRRNRASPVADQPFVEVGGLSASALPGAAREEIGRLPSIETELFAQSELANSLDAMLAEAGTEQIDPALWRKIGRLLQQRLESATSARWAWMQRLDTRNAGKLAFMRAPERMVVVDPPVDPDQPSISLTVIALVLIGSSVLFGIGLAIAAEVLDQRIRTVDRLAVAAGVPVLGKLPWIFGRHRA